MLISYTRGSCASKSCISTRPFKLRATPPLQPLPPLPQCKHFVNLTNGVEALPMLQDLGLSFSYVRLQSTACEQQRYEQLMMSLDANLLMALAVGHCTLVYDAGSRIPEWGVPRAVWQGLTFARWALTRLWLGPEAATVCGALVKGHNTTGIFEMYLDNFSGSTKKHLKYFSKWLPETGLRSLRLHGVYRATRHDSDTSFHRSLVRAFDVLDSQPTQPLIDMSCREALSRPLLHATCSNPTDNTSHPITAVPASSKQGYVLPNDPSAHVLSTYGWWVFYRGLSYEEFQEQTRARAQ
ncbi:hypothetical protein V8C86DRAFT_2882099 [Haematococcus lacustris]